MLSSFFKSRSSNLIGVDIGSHSVKAVLLAKSNTGYQVEAFAMLPISKGLIVDHTINDVEATGAVLKMLRKRF